MKKIITGELYKPTQNDKDLKLLRMILANVFEIEPKDWKSTELRAFAIGRLEGMISYKELTSPVEIIR